LGSTSAWRWRAKKAGEDQAIGGGGGGSSTRIHAVVDALGNPTGIHLTAGQVHDLAGSDERVIEPLRAAGKQAVIPSKKNREEPRPINPFVSS
jgi:hypothetical protein